MQLDLRRVDERIQKLQEIKRIAGDPELVALLFEFLDSGHGPASVPSSTPLQAARQESSGLGARPEEAGIVNQPAGGADSRESGLWSRKRA
ncbi:MAG: hypothetical protein M3N54_14555 [Acidobacteriota bacterium]|nr:hypothetical protein [Acidobacteriota bacterium]